MSKQRQPPLGGSIRNPDVQAVSDPKTLGPVTEQPQQFGSPTQSQQVPATQLQQSASQQPIQQQPIQQQPVQQQPVQQQPVQQQPVQQPIQQQPVQQPAIQRPIQQQPVQQPAGQMATEFPASGQLVSGPYIEAAVPTQSMQSRAVPQSVGQLGQASNLATPQQYGQSRKQYGAIPQQQFAQPVQQLPQQQFAQPVQQLPQQQFAQPSQQSAIQRQQLLAGQYDQTLGEIPVGNAGQYTTLSAPAASSKSQFLLAGAKPQSAQIAAQQPVQVGTQLPARVAARQPPQVPSSQLTQTNQSPPATTQQPPGEAFLGGFQQSIRPEATQRADLDPSLGRTDASNFRGVASNVASGIQSNQQPTGSNTPVGRSGMVAGSSSSAGSGSAVANTSETTEPGAM